MKPVLFRKALLLPLLLSVIATSCDSVNTEDATVYMSTSKPAPALPGGRAVVLSSCMCSTKTRTAYDP
ncbi:MAG: hypothetical protein QGH12_06425, partial [SAR324 cluster bacterium]|nr:hypothetical protein [SAR324 cluster bacterium]